MIFTILLLITLPVTAANHYEKHAGVWLNVPILYETHTGSELRCAGLCNSRRGCLGFNRRDVGGTNICQLLGSTTKSGSLVAEGTAMYASKNLLSNHGDIFVI